MLARKADDERPGTEHSTKTHIDTRGLRIQGIVLDAVGTLIEAHPDVASAYTQAANRQGVTLDRAEVRRRFGRVFHRDEQSERHGELRTDEAAEVNRWRRIVALVLHDVPDPEQAFAELWEHFARPDAWVVYPDALAAIDGFHNAGLRLVVASNFDSRLRSVLAGHRPVAELAETVVISSEIGWRKPHQRFFEAACGRLALVPRHVASIGDDAQNDGAGAHAAGLRSFVIDRKAAQDNLSIAPVGYTAHRDLDAVIRVILPVQA
jgi:putative hydrolase of the HAD superfamily